MSTGADGRAGIDAGLVARLVSAQYPRWAGLPVRPVEVDGHDNRTYRLGEDLTVRLPTAGGYVAGGREGGPVAARPRPAAASAVPVPVATGRPGQGYPFPWSVRRWWPGETARADRVEDLSALATSLAGFVRALQAIDATDGPRAGTHSFHRGASLTYYDGETAAALEALGPVLGGRLDTGRARAVWDAALAATFTGPPVWFHGDVAAGNLLVGGGGLTAVIDFGTCGVGDPACDLAIAWTLLSGESRAAFRAGVEQDPGAWARARGWALWKALISIDPGAGPPEQVAAHLHVVDEVLADADRRR